MVDGFSSFDPEKARGSQVDAKTYTKLYGKSSKKKRDGFSSADPEKAIGPQVDAKTYNNQPQPTPQSVEPTPTASTSVTQVQSYIEQKKTEDNLRNIEQGENTFKLLGIKKQSDPITKKLKSNLYSNMQSTAFNFTPSLGDVAELAEQRKISGKDYSYSTGQILNDYYVEFARRDNQNEVKTYLGEKEDWLEGRRSFYQEQINAGAEFDKINAQYLRDVDKANKDTINFQSEYYKNWESGRGNELKREFIKLSALTNLDAKYLDTTGKIPKFIGTGALIGGVTAAGGLVAASSLSAPALATIGTVGAVVGIGYAAYEYTKAGITGVNTYKQFEDIGFSKKESFLYGSFAGTTSLIPASFTALGGLAGSSVVMGSSNLLKTGKLFGYTKTDIKNFQEISSKKDILRITEIKGITKVSDLNVYNKGITTSSSGGSSLRTYKVSLDTSGLTASQKASALKLNLRGTFSQQTISNGKSVSGFDLFNIKTGGILGKTYTGASSFNGVISNNNILGFRTTYTSSGRDFNIGVERFIGTGKVSSNGNLRFEYGKGLSERFAQFNFRKGYGFSIDSQYNTEYLGADFTRIQTSGKTGTFSKLIGGEIIFKQFAPSVGSIKSTKVYTDIKGVGMSGKEFTEPLFTFTKAPSTRSFSYASSSSTGTSSNGRTVLSNLKVQDLSFISPPTSVQTQISTLRQSFAPQSFYYGKGTYEKTNSQQVGFSSPRSLSFMNNNNKLNQVGVSLLPIASSIPLLGRNIKTSLLNNNNFRVNNRQNLYSGIKPIQSQSLIERNFQEPKIIPNKITPLPFIPFLPMPKFLGADAYGGSKRIKATRTYRYTPSFGALALKGQKFRIGKITTKRFTGLEFRGNKLLNIIKSRKRKKKK